MVHPMSKSRPRKSKRLALKARSVASVVSENMSAPVISDRTLGRSHSAPNALGAKSARFNDPAGNTFKARYEPGSRPEYKRDERWIAHQTRHSAIFEACVVAYRGRPR
jgi:hypothetical protein